MTKQKATKPPKTAKKYIVASGSHSRQEGETRRKYEAGDLISITPEELARFPLKFMTLSEYESIVENDARQKEQDRALQKAMLPATVKKLGARDSEAIKRGKKLLKMKRGTQRRTLIS